MRAPSGPGQFAGAPGPVNVRVGWVRYDRAWFSVQSVDTGEVPAVLWPLIGRLKAARGLPHSGVENDLLHLSYGSSGALLFGSEETQYGLTLWNLLALQTLDLLRTQVLGG